MAVVTALLAACSTGSPPIGIRIETGGEPHPTTATGAPAPEPHETGSIADPGPEAAVAGGGVAPEEPAARTASAGRAPRDQAPPPVRTAFTQEVDGTALSFEMVPVPPGAVGHTPPASFWIGRTEVTWDLFDVYLFGLDETPDHVDLDAVARPSKPYISMDRGFGHAGYPVISPSYHAAENFCRWLSRKTGRTYRLPTVAEWNHVCGLSGIHDESLDAHAWTRENSDFRTHPVGKKAPDVLGLHDLLGNASEWATAADGSAVTLGGCFRDPRERVGCGVVVPESPDWNASDPQIPKSIWWLADGGFVGFRIVCVD